MFGTKREEGKVYTDKEVQAFKSELLSDHRIEIRELESNHEIALKEKEQEMKHFKDNELKAAKEEVTASAQKVAVLTGENKMLREITDLNADIIDIKDLVSKLIEKLPSVNISSLSVQGGQSSK